VPLTKLNFVLMNKKKLKNNNNFIFIA
jgi:hypothetical protein